MFLMLYTHEFMGISCFRPWPAWEKKCLVPLTDNCAILTLSIRVFGWIGGFLEIRLLTNELTNSMLKNWNLFVRYAGCFNFAFSSGCYETVHKLTNEYNILKYLSELSSFSACKPRVNKVLKTFGKNFMRLTSMVFVGQSQHAPSYATSPSSKIIFQRINVASMWNRPFFFFHYCDQSAMIYLNWCLWYQTINYDRVSSIFLSRSTWLRIKSVIDGTNQWASQDELRK